MRKVLLFAAICCMFSFVTNAQYTTADVFTIDEITFYGLDFSNVKLVGSDGFTDPWDIKNRLFNSWNMLFQSEQDKYDIATFCKKSTVNLNFDVVRERNQIPDPNELVVDKPYTFERDVVEKAIADYDTPETDGIGMVMMMESFDKFQKQGSMWVTFFDISTKKVLFTERMSGKAQGFGIRNYYANTYYMVLKEIGKKKWDAWSAMY